MSELHSLRNDRPKLASDSDKGGSRDHFTTPVTLVVPTNHNNALTPSSEANLPSISVALLSDTESTPSVYFSAQSSFKESAPTLGSFELPPLPSGESAQPTQQPHEHALSLPAFNLLPADITNNLRRIPSISAPSIAPSLRTSATAARSRISRPDPPEVAAKKTELAAAELELQSVREQVTRSGESCNKRREELGLKKQQLNERTLSFTPFLEENKRKLERSGVKFERELKIRQEKEQEIREIQGKLDGLGSRISTLAKLKESFYKAYKQPILSSLPLLFRDPDMERLESSNPTSETQPTHHTFIHATAGTDPDIDDVVIAYRTLQSTHSRLLQQHSAHLAAQLDLQSQIAAVLAESDQSRNTHLTRLSQHSSTKSELLLRTSEASARLESDKKKYKELRKHVIEIQETVYRFLEKVEDAISRRGSKILGGEHVLEMSATPTNTEEVDMDDLARFQEIRTRDLAHTRSLKSDLEELRRVWSEVALLVTTIRTHEKNKGKPVRRRT